MSGVSVDVSVASGSNTSTWNHTCTAGANLLLVSEGNASGSGGVQASAVTYNGLSLTRLSYVIGGSYFESSLWYLVSPPTGVSYAVVISGTQRSELLWRRLNFIF